MIKTEWADSDSLAHNTYREATNLCSPRQSPPTSTTSYDDWNLVHEIRVSGSYQTSHVDYFWGPDLSGTLQGAGGVGGLVAVSVDGDFYFPGYDNNGNVVGYWDESGSLVAEYAYDAFGNTIVSSGTMASVFPHRFSTKYYDPETDLYYYGYRYYSPSLGRWISRDPIEEVGGENLFFFVCNHPLSSVDPFGQTLLEKIAQSILQPYVDRIHYYLSEGMETSAIREARKLYVLIAGWGSFIEPLAADLLGNWLIGADPDFRDPYILKTTDVKDALLDGRLHYKSISNVDDRNEDNPAFGMNLGEFMCCFFRVTKGAKLERLSIATHMTAVSSKFSLALGTFRMSFTGSVARSKRNVITAEGIWTVEDTYDWHAGQSARVGSVVIPDEFALLVEKDHWASSFEIKGSWKGKMEVDCSSNQMKARAR